MNASYRKKNSSIVIVFIVLFLFSSPSWALEQHGKFWLGLNYQHTLSKDKKWLSFVFSQFRFIDERHPLQASILEGGLGYKLPEDKTLWLGYRWTGRNPNDGFTQENFIFQQIIFEKKIMKSTHLVFRSRFEEIRRTDQPQTAIRLRQRIALTIKKSLFEKVKMNPFIYDELFIPLNHTVYMPTTIIGENRIFFGFNFILDKESWWEMGYMNQYQLHTHEQPENQMSHVLSVTYIFS